VKDHRYDDGTQVHACEGGYAAVEGRSPYMVWTLCEKDVPENESYEILCQEVTCADCLFAMERYDD